MVSEKTMYFVSLILCFFIFSDVGNSEFLGTDCGKLAGFNASSPNGTLFLSNKMSLLSVLSSNASRPNGFYNYTTGGGAAGTAVYGLFLCRGDVIPAVCQDCLVRAVAELVQTCSNVTRAVTWYDECMLRYSDLPIFSKVDLEGGYLISDKSRSVDGALLNKTLGEVFNKITVQAAYGNVTGKRFAVGEANLEGFAKMFALGQCTPDLSDLDCEYCLRDAIMYLPQCCSNRPGGRVIGASCNIRYSTTPFYASVAPPPLPALPRPPPQIAPPVQPTPSPPSLPDGGTSTATIAAIVSPIRSTALVVFVVAFFICFV